MTSFYLRQRKHYKKHLLLDSVPENPILHAISEFLLFKVYRAEELEYFLSHEVLFYNNL